MKRMPWTWGVELLFLIATSLLLPLSIQAQDEKDPSPPSPPESPEEGATSSWFRTPNLGYGPFHGAALGFFPSLRPGLVPRAPADLAQGTVELRATESWAKVISEKSGSFDLDYEVLRTEGAISYGLAEGMLLEMDFDTGTRVNGILDPLMNGFHNTFGIPLGPRGRLPNNSFRIQLEPGQGRPDINLDHDSGQTYTRTLILAWEHMVTYGDDSSPALGYSLSVGPRLGPFENLRGGSPVDLSLSVCAAKGWGDFRFSLAADGSWYGQEHFMGTTLRTYQWGFLGAVEWNCLTDFSLVFQLLSMSGIVDRFDRHSSPSFEGAYGFKWEILKDFQVGLSMIHELENPVNAPDFGFQLELILRWGGKGRP
jgi:hypothetical protein